MLEPLYTNGVPIWWKRSPSDFKREYHEVFDKWVADLDEATPENKGKIFEAVECMIESGYLDPLQADPSREQYTSFLEQGKKSMLQQYALEMIIDMWCKE